MAEYIELIDKYRIEQGEGDYNPPSYVWVDNTGEIVRCGECSHCYAEGFKHERNICEKHPELGNVPDDWFCADGEREVQE